jgi:3-methyl-2-oxobutanoate hydroxymethyltransferase
VCATRHTLGGRLPQETQGVAAARPGVAYNGCMPTALTKKVTLNDLRAARTGGNKVAMLTCYDYTTARLMQEAGVPVLLVGDSAANVVLGHPTTLPVSLSLMIELTAAVRRGAPLALLVGDMPFGSYQGALGSAVRNVCQMVKRSGCDLVKLEVAGGHARLVRSLADAGVAVMAHIGLRPQSVGLMGGYKYQGRTAEEAADIVRLARTMERAGAAVLLLEAVPPEVSEAVVRAVNVPVIGCGAGPACHGYVVVTHDAVGLTPQAPRFVPKLGDLAGPAVRLYGEYVRQVSAGEYPAAEHNYEMHAEQRAEFLRSRSPRELQHHA